MIITLVQGTDEWKAARTGSLGASRVHDALARTKSGWGASRGNLQAELLVERLTGVPTESFVTAAMRQGSELEPDARTAYEFETNLEVIQIGMFKHPTIPWTHASPDGLIGDHGLLEIKCPQPAAHLDFLLGSFPERYLLQMQWQMCCGDRAWADFVSYNPAFPAEMRLIIKRVHRDDVRIAEMEREVLAFLAELDGKLSALKARMSPALEYLRAR